MKHGLLVFFLILGVIAFAQVEQGNITGTVTDESGAVVPGAKIIVKNVKTGVRTETQANESGLYRVLYLPTGEYEIDVEKEGFSRARLTGIGLTVGLTATVDVILKTGTVQQEITVTASAVMLEQQTSSLGNVVTTRQIIELPLLGRNPYNLVLLAPGVMPKGGAGAGPIIN
jgi:hypothetical protein